MRIAITGANGFIGHRLVESLAGEHELLCIDNLSLRGWVLNAGAYKRVSLVEADVRYRRDLGHFVSEFGPQVMIHLAGIHFIPQCNDRPDYTRAVNENGTKNVCEVLPTDCKLIFASSAAVYRPAQARHKESDALGPVDVYGHSKLQAEKLVAAAARARGFSAIIMRLFNVIGTGDPNPHLVPALLEQIYSGETTIRMGNPEPLRDYVFIEDVVCAVHRLLEVCASTEPATFVNIGTGSAYSAANVLSSLGIVAGLPLTYYSDNALLRPIDRPVLCANVSFARRRFGWQAEHDLQDALSLIWTETRAGVTQQPSISYQKVPLSS